MSAEHPCRFFQISAAIQSMAYHVADFRGDQRNVQKARTVTETTVARNLSPALQFRMRPTNSLLLLHLVSILNKRESAFSHDQSSLTNVIFIFHWNSKNSNAKTTISNEECIKPEAK